MTLAVLTSDELAAIVRREVEPLRQELAKLAQARRSEPVTLEEAAKHWGVSTRTMRRWVRSGQAPSVRVGGTVRVHLDAIDPAR